MIVVDVDPAEPFGLLFGQSGGGRDSRCRDKEQNEKKGRTEASASEQAPECAAWVEEHGGEGDKEHQIARIGDRDAIRVGIHSEGTSVAVGVERTLIKTHAVEGEDVVHRHASRFLLIVSLEGEIRFVVGGRLCTLVKGHAKPIESHIEGQLALLPVLFVEESAGGLSLSQMKRSGVGCETRESGSDQDNE